MLTSHNLLTDISMWSVLLTTWNGISIIQTPVSACQLNLFTEASFRELDCYFNGSWLSAKWPTDVPFFNIAYLELFAVYVALITWGNKLYDQHIFSDNEATVYV